MAKQINVDVNLRDEEAQKKLKDIQNGKYKVDVDVSSNSTDKTTKKINELSYAAKHSQTTFDKLKNTVSGLFSGKNLAFTAYLAALNEVRKAAKSTREEITDLDKSVTDLSVAMGDSRGVAANYLKQLNRQAQDIGATTKEVADSADSWLRQGKSIKETGDLVYNSMMLSKLGQIESADASKYLTSALNGYKKSASEAIDVVDKLTAVDMQSASDAGGLAESMSKTASAADMAGVSIDKLIGMIATVKEVTQDSDESVGNMFKSVFSRMNQIKAGKFVDLETGESLNDTEKVLTKVGIAMRDANGQFFSSEKIMDEVGAKWNSFDTVTQRAVATAMAGTYQYNKLIALFDNYNNALKYTQVSAESAGTAIEKFNASYKDSLEAKANSLQASFESMILDSDLSNVYGNIIDATNALVQFIDKTGALKAALTGGFLAGGIKAFTTFKVAVDEGYINLNRFKNSMDIVGKTKVSGTNFERLLNLTSCLSKSQLKLIVSSKSLTLAQRTQILMASGLSKEEAKLQLQSWNLTKANNGLTKSTTSAKNAFSGLWTLIKANPVAVVSTVATAGFMMWQKYNDTIKEIKDSAKELSESFKTSQSEISDYKSKVEELQKTISDSSSSYADVTEARKQLITIQNEMIDKYGTEKSSIKAITDAINGETDAWERLTDKQWEASKVDFNSTGGIIKEISNALNGYKDNIDRMKKEYGNYSQTISFGDITGADNRKQAEELLKRFGTFTKTSAGIGEITLSGNADEVYNQILQIKEVMSDIGADFGKSFSNDLDKMASSAKDVSDSYKDMYNQYVLYEEILSDTDYKNTFKKLSDEYQNYQDALTSGSEEGLKNETDTFVKMITDAMSTALSNGDNDVAEYFKYMYPELQSEIDSWDFKIKLTPTLNGKDNASFDQALSDSLSEAMSHFENAEEILNFNPKANTDESKQKAYDQLSAIATQDFEGDMEALVNTAVKLFYLQTQGQQDFLDRINGNKEFTPTAGIGNLTSDSNKSINVDSTTASNWYGQLSEDEQNLANSTDFVNALQAQSDAMNGAALSASDFDTALQSIKTTASDTGNSLTSFDEAWINLKATDDGDLKGDADDLLELAEAGQLTENALGELAGGQKLMDDTGLSAETLAEKINGLVNASTQLSSMSAQISKMSDMLADKKNGTTASADDLAGFDASVRGLESWDEFEEVMGSSESSMEQCQEAANALATEWVNDGNFLSNLTDENKAYYETQLDQMGVANAQEVVENALAIARENEATQTEYATIATQHNSEAKSENEKVSTDLTNATASEIAQLLTEANVSEATKGKIVELWLAKVDLNSTKINTASDVEQIVAIANAAGASVGYVNALKKALNDLVDAQTPSHKPSDLSIDGFNTINDWKNESNKSDFEKFVDNMEKQQKQNKVDDLLSKFKQNIKGTQLKTSDFQINSSGSKPYKDKDKSKGKGSSSKKSKTEIDWIERKITILNNKIDAFATKASDTWSSWTSRSKALNDEMETTKKLLTSVYGISSKTQKKLNSQRDTAKTKLNNYVKDNSKVLTSSTIKKIKSGKLDTSRLSKKDKKVIEEYKKLQKDYNKKASKAKKASEKNPAADYYFAKANKVAKKYKLSPAIIKKIKNGTINISDYNESMANAIQKYQDYYDKGKDAQKSKKETKQKLNELAQQNFELIQSKWDSRIGYQENRKNAVSDALNLAQSKGKLIGTAYYTKQKGINNKEINKYKQEETELKKAMKNVPKYSEQWYQYKADLSEVHSKYVQLQADNAELQNSINELKFDRFDELINKFDDIIDESDFLIDLLDSDNLFNSDNGSITNDGITAMGLTAQNYDVYLAEAEQYKKQIADLEQMYKNGEIGLTQYNSQMREYQQGQRDSIKSANEAKKSLVAYVKQGLDAQNSALEEAISKKKELLETEKDLKEWNDKLADSNKNIAKLEKQIAALEGDDSEENRKKLQQLKSDLQDAKSDRSDMIYDRSVSDQEDALDKMLENSKKQAEDYLKNSNQVFVDALGYVNKNTEQVSNNIEKISKDLGISISDYITNAWKDSGDAVGTYESTLSSNVPKITSQIQLITNAWNAQCKAANKAAQASANAAAGGDETTKDTDKKGNANSGSSNKTNTSSAKDIKAFIQKSLNKAGQKKSYYGALNRYLYEKTGGKVLSVSEEVQLAKMLGVSVKKDLSGTGDRQKILDALKKKKIAFANGGVLGDLVKLSGEDGLFIGSAGESILTKEQTQALINFRPVIPQLNTMVDLMKNVPIGSASQSPTYNIDNRTIVEGVATDQIVKQMEGVAQRQAKTIIKEINNVTYGQGVRRR